jgi:hypothetical protein
LKGEEFSHRGTEDTEKRKDRQKGTEERKGKRKKEREKITRRR